MYTIILLTLLLLLSIFGTLLYYKNKKAREQMLEDGECPNCGSLKKSFKDSTTGVVFESSPIKQRVLRSHGCSGVVEIEYICINCDLKEVYNRASFGC
jgi:hypothetical protein